MDIFVFYDEDKDFSMLIRLNGSDSEVSFENIMDKFIEVYKEKAFIELEKSNLKLFVVDTSHPLKTPEPKQVIDLSRIVIYQGIREFDIIICENSEPPAQKSIIPTIQQKSKEKDSTSETAPHVDEIIQRGILYMEIKDYKDACVVFQRVRILKENDPRPVYYLTKILMKTHRYKVALSNACSGVQLFPYDRKMYLLYAKIYQKLGQHQEAIRVLRLTLFNWKLTEEEENNSLYLIALSLVELGELDEAATLISSKTNHVKCISLYASILARQNRFLEAVRVIQTIFTITPDFIPMAKFIAEHVTTPERATILKSELGDNAYNNRALFFVGNTLHNCGEFKLAWTFYIDALAQCEATPAISLGCLRCLLGITQSPKGVLTFCDTFLKSPSMNFGTSPVYPILYGESFSPDFDAPQKAAKPFSPVVFDDGDPPFHTDHLDSIAFLIQLQVFFFTTGFVGKSEQVAEALEPMLCPFDMRNTIIAHEAMLFALLKSVAPTIARPLPALPPVYIVGDHACLPLSFSVLPVDGTPRVARAVFIDGLSLRRLASPKRSPQKRLFASRVWSLESGTPVVLCLGEADVKRGMIEKMERIKYDKFEDAFAEPIRAFVALASSLARVGGLRVFIHPVLPTHPATREQVMAFNGLLWQRMAPLAADGTVSLLSFLDRMLEDDRLTIREPYRYNDMFPSPTYADLVREAFKNIPAASVEKEKQAAE